MEISELRRQSLIKAVEEYDKVALQNNRPLIRDFINNEYAAQLSGKDLITPVEVIIENISGKVVSVCRTKVPKIIETAVMGGIAYVLK